MILMRHQILLLLQRDPMHGRCHRVRQVNQHLSMKHSQVALMTGLEPRLMILEMIQSQTHLFHSSQVTSKEKVMHLVVLRIGR